MLTPAQERMLTGLLEVPDGARKSDLERSLKGSTTVSGKGMVAAFDRVAEVAGLGCGSVALDGVPQRRVVELARWGMAGKAPALRRHPSSRKLATLLATVVYLEAEANDDALELFDMLMTNESMARAVRESKKETLRRYPRVSRDAATCAAAVGVLLESVDRGNDVSLAAIWEAIESVVSRSALRARSRTSPRCCRRRPTATPVASGEWR